MQKLISKLTKHQSIPLILSICLFLLLELRIFNLGISYRDEGFTFYKSFLILHGLLPFKDFFDMVMPMSDYIQSLNIIILGNTLLSGRILYVFFSVIMLYLLSKTFRLPWFANLIYLLLTSMSFIIMDAYSIYNQQGLLLFIATIWILREAFIKNSYRLFFLLGVVAIVVLFTKQSYGLVDIVAICISMTLLYWDSPKRLSKSFLIYILGLISSITVISLFLISQHALAQLIYYTFIFSDSVKSHRQPFLFTAILFVPFYLFILTRINKITYKKSLPVIISFILISLLGYFLLNPSRINRFSTILLDPTSYYYIGFLIIPITIFSKQINSKIIENKYLAIYSIFALGLFFASSASGRDYNTVWIVAPILCPIIFLVILKNKRLFSSINILLSIIITLYFLPFPIITTMEYLQYIHKPVARLHLPVASGIYINRLQAQQLEAIDRLVNKDKYRLAKVLCFPYCPMVNYLIQRPSPSYYNFFYREVFLDSNQLEVMRDLNSDKNALVILQRKGELEPEAEYENNRLGILTSYFSNNYHTILKLNDFTILERNRQS